MRTTSIRAVARIRPTARATLTFALLGAAIAAASSAHAQRLLPYEQERQEAEEAERRVQTFNGTIERVSGDSIIIATQDEDRSRITVDASAAISVDGQNAAFEALQPGQIAIVSALEIKGELFAAIVAARSAEDAEGRGKERARTSSARSTSGT